SARLRLRRILVHQLLRTAFFMESNGFHCGFLSSLSMPRLAFCLSSLRRSLTGPGYNFGEASGFFSCRFRRRTSSTLNGESAPAPRSSAPPAAEKTEKLRGAFTPKRHGHRQSKGGQKSSTQQSNDASVPTDSEEKTEESFSRRGDLRQGGDH